MTWSRAAASTQLLGAERSAALTRLLGESRTILREDR